MSTSVAAGIVAMLTGAGLGMLVYAALGSGVELMKRLTTGRARRALAIVMHRSSPQERAPGEDVTRNLVLWIVVSAVGGLLVSVALIPEGPMRAAGLVAAVAPLVWRRQRISALRQEIRKEVADLLENIRLQMAFGGSLGGSLALLAETGGDGPVYRRLREYQAMMNLQGPEAILGRLGEELESRELQMFLARLEMARHGHSSYEQVLEEAVSEAVRENRRAAEAEIEGAPLRLLLPMLFLLFPPVLVLVLYPPAYALIAQLAGAGSSVIP